MNDTAAPLVPPVEPDQFISFLGRLCERPGARARLRRTLSAANPTMNPDVLMMLGPFIPHDLDDGRFEIRAAIAGIYAAYGTGPGQQWWSPGSELGASVRAGRIGETRADRALLLLLRPSSTSERIGHLRRILPSCGDPSRLDWSLLRRDLDRLAVKDSRRVSQRWARDYAQQRTNRNEGDHL